MVEGAMGDLWLVRPGGLGTRLPRGREQASNIQVGLFRPRPQTKNGFTKDVQIAITLLAKPNKQLVLWSGREVTT